ncbi:hypothetical protein [uncultured Paraglaciecola sp.]|uniref:hypothetical protein n=1 Tax=uncultured Paraglaciecola sp. TaxID=1765024 RepID=UPI0026056271|nr:hypothetical protein [uncultured Paraglaciecola sp.]
MPSMTDAEFMRLIAKGERELAYQLMTVENHIKKIAHDTDGDSWQYPHYVAHDIRTLADAIDGQSSAGERPAIKIKGVGGEAWHVQWGPEPKPKAPDAWIGSYQSWVEAVEDFHKDTE